MREVLLRGRASVVLLALATGAFAFNTVEMMPMGVLPQLAESFSLSRSSAGTLMSGYALVVALATVPLVHLSRRLPKRHVVAALLFVLAVCTAVFASTDSASVAFSSRFATAAAHGLMWSLMAPLAVSHFSPGHRGRVLSFLSMGAALAAVLGVPGLTLLTSWVGWRAALLAWIGLALLAGLTVATCALPGGAEAAGGSADGRAAAASWTAFVATLATIVLSVSAVFSTMTYLALIARHWSVGTGVISLALSAFGLAGFVGAVAAGRRLDHGLGQVLAAATVLLIAGLATLAVAPPSDWTLVLALFLVGAGAVAVPLSCQHMLFDVSPLSIPMALALSSFTFNVGVAGGAIAGGGVLEALSTPWLAPVSLALALAAGIPAAVAVRSRPPHDGLPAGA